MCDSEKVQDTFKQIEHKFNDRITGVIAVRFDTLVDCLSLIRVSECRHLRCEARVGVVSRRVPEGVWCQRLWRL